MIVAIHSTALGPALGGVRLWHYEATVDGARDALRLARGMTYKAAAAGLALGGGKGVICAPEGAPPAGQERRELLLDFGDLVESLGGRYITAEDVGIAAEDLVAIGERTSHMTGLPADHGGSGDPSPFTALGVEAAMRACARERFGSPDLSGRRIVVAGLGHVGSRLARRLAHAGAELAVSDIDPAKRSLASELEAEWIEPSKVILTECDLLAPCALGGAIDAANLPRLRCQIVCGCANNQLADEGLAGRCRRAGHPLRARLHRQRRRPDPRLQGDPRLLGARGPPARARNRGQSEPHPRRRPRALDHAAARRARARPGAPRCGAARARGRRMRD